MKLLVAPAGYGKSTLARQWTADRPRAWYRVSLGRFRRSLGEPRHRRCRRRSASRLQPPRSRSASASRRTLTRSTPRSRRCWSRTSTSWPEDAWLVLDDAQLLLEREPTSEFVSTLLRESRVNALLCTRQRPAWITARDLLYGHALEIGRNSLAMTHEEAAAVMPDIAATAGVVALADGWPAVVGLASLTPEPTLMSGMTAGLPEALYDYLAEELYQALPAAHPGQHVPDRRRRRPLATADRAALPGTRARQDARATSSTPVGSRSDADGNFELHPLLEAFLRQKLDEGACTGHAGKSKRVTETLIAEQHWDEAFSVIERYGDRRGNSSRCCVRPSTTSSRAAARRRSRGGSRTPSERSTRGAGARPQLGRAAVPRGQVPRIRGARVDCSRGLGRSDWWASRAYATSRSRGPCCKSRGRGTRSHYRTSRRDGRARKT